MAPFDNSKGFGISGASIGRLNPETGQFEKLSDLPIMGVHFLNSPDPEVEEAFKPIDLSALTKITITVKLSGPAAVRFWAFLNGYSSPLAWMLRHRIRKFSKN